MQIENVTLTEVIAAARGDQASLVPEAAGYLMLGIGRAMAGVPIDVDPGRIVLTTEGAVSLRGSQTAIEAGTACSRARRLFAELLAVAHGSLPALAQAAKAPRTGTDSFGKLLGAVSRALIPMNRDAAKRALARLARETLRARQQGGLSLAGAPSGPALGKDREDAAAELTPSPAHHTASPTPTVVDDRISHEHELIEAARARLTLDQSVPAVSPASDRERERPAPTSRRPRSKARKRSAMPAAKAIEGEARASAGGDCADGNEVLCAAADYPAAAAELPPPAAISPPSEPQADAEPSGSVAASPSSAPGALEPAPRSTAAATSPEVDAPEAPLPAIAAAAPDAPLPSAIAAAAIAAAAPEAPMPEAPLPAIAAAAPEAPLPAIAAAAPDAPLPSAIAAAAIAAAAPEAPPEAAAFASAQPDLEPAPPPPVETASAPPPPPVAGAPRPAASEAGIEIAHRLFSEIAALAERMLAMREVRPAPPAIAPAAAPLAPAPPPVAPAAAPDEAPAAAAPPSAPVAPADTSAQRPAPAAPAAAAPDKASAAAAPPSAPVAPADTSAPERGPLEPPPLPTDDTDGGAIERDGHELAGHEPKGHEGEQRSPADASPAHRSTSVEALLDRFAAEQDEDEALRAAAHGLKSLAQLGPTPVPAPAALDAGGDPASAPGAAGPLTWTPAPWLVVPGLEDDLGSLPDPSELGGVLGRAAAPSEAPAAERTGSAPAMDETTPVPQSTSLPPWPPPSRRRPRATTVLSLGLLLAGLAAVAVIWERRPETIGRGHDGAAAEPVGGTVPPADPECRTLLTLRALPRPHEVLVRLGGAPLLDRPLPIGVRLELVATAPGHRPERLIVAPDAAWQATEAGRVHDLDASLAPGAEDDWPAAPAGEVGGVGPEGRIRPSLRPASAELWLVSAAGEQDTARVALPCGETAHILIVNPLRPSERRRLTVTPAELAAAAQSGPRELGAMP